MSKENFIKHFTKTPNKLLTPWFNKIINNNLLDEYSENHLFFDDNLFSINLITNLDYRLQTISKKLSEDIVISLIKEKLAAGKNNYCQMTLLQVLSEIEVMCHLFRFCNITEIQYEPKLNGKKNPELLFNLGSNKIEIEVKCPDFSKQESPNAGDLIINYRILGVEKIPVSFVGKTQCQSPQTTKLLTVFILTVVKP